MSSDGRGPLFTTVVVAGGLLHGFGLAYSRMARPEIVLDFLQLEDLGLLFVMGGAAFVTGLAIQLGTRVLETAPLTGTHYTGREKGFDRNVVAGGIIFGVGWGALGRLSRCRLREPRDRQLSDPLGRRRVVHRCVRTRALASSSELGNA